MYVNTQARPGAATVLNNMTSAKQTSTQSEQQTAESANQDAAIFTYQDQKAARASAVKDSILELQKSFANVSIVMSSALDTNSLSRTAAGLGSGLHLILTRDFVDRMGSSQEEYEKCTAQLKNILAALSENTDKSLGAGAYVDKKGVRFWQTDTQESKEDSLAGDKGLRSMLDEMKKNSQQQKTSSQTSEKKLRTGTKSVYSVLSVYARLANASTKGQVSAAMGQAQRKIGTIRAAANQGDGSERAQARAAIASCRNLLIRGRRKIRQLDQESIAKMREKQALKKANSAHIQQVRREAARLRTVRRSNDNAIFTEGVMRDMAALVRLCHYNDNEDKVKDTSVYVAPYIPQLSVAAVALTAGAAAATSTASATVTVSVTVTF
jgi:hypothetical protein